METHFEEKKEYLITLKHQIREQERANKEMEKKLDQRFAAASARAEAEALKKLEKLPSYEALHICGMI
ncbi:hypothetical protein B7O87_09555 [Cylindrospermopsis raciborskii CENA303]|uniref:Uncharacterized protein n=1 Tax=Cylindrospermopsis raciborskii CENA303 TaxID=1170769 RepID=A0A1X4G6B7_9CYAN|nr:hypothetical protein [Cylindrospermopsis raciborskii]OSO90270.1 hypothetical protein B7O87_09555 [Cylindrospermopsis raciborskii CENA303]